MSQHDYVIANGTGAAVRSDLNNGLAAIVSQNSGTTEPTTTYAYMRWADTTAGVMKMRNGANNAWITLYQLDGEWSTIAFENGSAAAPSIYFKDSGTDTGFYSPAANEVAVATNGTGRLFVDSSGRVGFGVASPGYPIDLVSQSGESIRIRGTSGTEISKLLFTSNSAGADYGWLSSASSYLAFGTASTERMRLTSTGLGIGSNNPQSLLHLETDGTALRIVRGSAIGFAYNTGTAATDAFRLQSNGGSVDLFSAVGQPITFSAGTTEKARVDGSGRLLVGTSTAFGANSELLHIASPSAGSIALLRDDTSIGSGNELGGIRWYSNATTSSTYQVCAQVRAVAEDTFADGDKPTRLEFSVTRDSEASPKEALRIDNQGRVTIGTANTVSGIALNVYGSSTSNNDGTFTVGNANSADAACIASFYTATNSTATSNVLLRFGINGYASGSGQINANGASAAAFGTFSDARLKENIEDLPSQWDNIKSLRPVEFDYVESFGGGHQIGFIAQEMQTVYPDAVGIGEDEMLTVTAWSKTEARLVKALQEALERIETLEAAVTALQQS